MLKMSSLTKLLKEYALNPASSDEEFLNAFLCPFVTAGNIKNKNLEEFHLNPSRTSELMNQKAEVPQALRRALPRYGIKEETIEEMVSFVEDYLNPNRYPQLVGTLSNLMKEEGIGSIPVDDTLKVQNILSVMLTELLMKAISESNLAAPEIILLWKRGRNSIDVQSGDLFHFGFDNRHKKRTLS